MVRFEHVGMRYGCGPEVFDDISFALEPGSFHFIAGPSGAGKSSLLRLLYLGHRPSSGTIRMFGEDVTVLGRRALTALRQKIGVVFQDFRLIDHLSVWENVALPLRVAGGRESAFAESVAEMIDWVGLGDRRRALPPTLSGGEKQRLAIARAVIRKPRLLLADEPTGNVDRDNGERILRLFDGLNQLGTTIVIATHDERLIARYGYGCLRLAEGRLLPDEARLAAQ